MAFHKEKESKEFKNITPFVAPRLLEMNIEIQRRKKEYEVDKLGRAMLKGNFNHSQIDIVLVLDPKTIPPEYADLGNAILVNGQHRCSASVKYNASFSATVVTHYCDSWDDMVRFCRTINKGRGDSESDMNRRWLMEIHKTGDWSRPLIQSIKAALLMLSEYRTLEVSHIERLEILEENRPLIQDIVDILKSAKSPRAFCKKPVIASMIMTIRRNRALAIPFWKRICTVYNIPKATIEGELGRTIPDMKASTTEHVHGLVIKIIRGWNRRHPKEWITIEFLTRDTVVVKELESVTIKSVETHSTKEAHRDDRTNRS